MYEIAKSRSDHFVLTNNYYNQGSSCGKTLLQSYIFIFIKL